MSEKPEQLAKDELMPQTQPDVAWLCEARERKGLTAVKRLPPTFFTRGFVKAYAKEVGLNPDETADRYLRQIAPDALTTDAEDAATIVATAVARTGGVAFENDDTAHLHQEPGKDRLGRLTLAAAMVGMVVYVGPFNWDGWSSKVAASGVAHAPSVEAPAPAAAPATATETAPAPLAADVNGGPLQFEMNPKGPCWFSAAADGNQVQSELLEAGVKRSFEARDELVLRLGDPEACVFLINGRTGKSGGTPGVPVTVRITKENLQEFVVR